MLFLANLPHLVPPGATYRYPICEKDAASIYPMIVTGFCFLRNCAWRRYCVFRRAITVTPSAARARVLTPNIASIWVRVYTFYLLDPIFETMR